MLSNVLGATLARPIANGRILDDDGGSLQPARDVNGDGWADLVWRHDTTGGLSSWLLQDAQVVSSAPLYPPSQPDLAWRIVGVADMNRDGQLDLVWQHTDGPLVAWFMNGLTITTAEWFVPSSAGAPEWRVQGVR